MSNINGQCPSQIRYRTSCRAIANPDLRPSGKRQKVARRVALRVAGMARNYGGGSLPAMFAEPKSESDPHVTRLSKTMVKSWW
ncbi:MAG: hypothetical protein IPP36_01400 [Nitrosomonadales bacterium]|nr:hypothetical protein [Nitrosomonadales bacterium]